MLVYFMLIWNILRSFGIFYGHLVGNVLVIRYIFPRLGLLCQEKSGNSGAIEQTAAGKTVNAN
jgi:hypothetical protein